MRISKRFFTVVLAVTLLLAMAVQYAAAAVEIKVAFWDFGADGRKTWEYAFNEFNKSQDKVVAVADPIPGAMWAVLLARIAGGSAPDITWLSSESAQEFIQRGMLMDITPYVKRDNYDTDDFFPNQLAAFTANNKIYGIPTGAAVDLLTYNVDMFDAAGVEYPNKDWTWDDLLAAARKLVIRDGSGKAKQFGFTGFFGFFANGGSWHPVVWSNGGAVFNKRVFPTESYATSKEVIDALTFVRDFRFKYKAERMPDETSGDLGGSEKFVAGSSAMCFGHVNIGVDIAKAKAKFRWNIETYPKGSEKKVGIARPVALGILNGSKNPDAAWEFIKFYDKVLGGENLLTPKMSGTTPVSSVRKSQMKTIIANHPDKKRNNQAVVETMVVGEALNYVAPPGVTFDPFNEGVNRIFNGEMDVAPAMKQVKPVMDAALRKAAK